MSSPSFMLPHTCSYLVPILVIAIYLCVMCFSILRKNRFGRVVGCTLNEIFVHGVRYSILKSFMFVTVADKASCRAQVFGNWVYSEPDPYTTGRFSPTHITGHYVC